MNNLGIGNQTGTDGEKMPGVVNGFESHLPLDNSFQLEAPLVLQSDATPNLDFPVETSGNMSAQEIRDTIEQIYDLEGEEVKDGPVAQESLNAAIVEGQTVIDGAPDGDSSPNVDRLVNSPEKPRFKVRGATLADINEIVEVDIKTFKSVYENYDVDQDVLREDLRQKFTNRLEKIGSKWMTVLEKDGKVVGVLVTCPTSKQPEDFHSWEETTDHGTLETTYDPQGKNLYIVTFSVDLEGAKAKNMLLADQIGRFVGSGYDMAYFESRMPGMRRWVLKNKCSGSQEVLDQLTEEQKETFAQEYFEQKIELNGRRVRKDKLIRLYESVGCRSLRIVPNAYNDKPSMDFGVVCIYDKRVLFDGSMLPFRLPNNKVTRWLLGGLLRTAAKSHNLTDRIFA